MVSVSVMVTLRERMRLKFSVSVRVVFRVLESCFRVSIIFQFWEVILGLESSLGRG